MRKILVINTVGFQYEGITSVILNYTNAMDRTGLSFTFPVYEDIPPELKKKLEELGKTAMVPNRKQNVREYIKALHRLMKKGFDVLHVHGNSGTMLIETVIAKWGGVKKIILHTHSTSTNYPAANAVMKYPMMLLANEQLACSAAAGAWLYGNRKHTVLNNAIDLRSFSFEETNRIQHRRALGVKEDELLLGHIGHFTQQKNHPFLIEIFCCYQRMEPRSKLLLIGDGPDRPKIEQMVESLALKDKVIFAGRRSDVAQLYSAMDLLLLPSKWEGLPLTMLEAQANGLTLLVSDVITREAHCTERVFTKALADGEQSWAEEIHRIRADGSLRDKGSVEKVSAHGFDIVKEAEKLRNIYMR